MASYSQFSVVGGAFLVVAALMILGLMRESIPYSVRRGAQVALFTTAFAGVLWYASRNVSGVRWPAWQSTPATAALPADPTPQPKRKATPAPVTTQLRTGTMREVSTAEAARLLAKGRAFREAQEKAATQSQE